MYFIMSNIVENITEPSSPVVEKKKRGRKKGSCKKDKVEIEPENKPPPKKRGRKPKGGKIIQHNIITEPVIDTEPNVILHLKCSLNDIINNTIFSNYTYNPNIESIQSYNSQNNNTYFNINENDNNHDIEMDYKIPNDNNTSNIVINNEKNDTDDTKLIWKKLNLLKINLHKNNISDKRSDCFWCTYAFDNPPIFIPQHEIKQTYHVYGCFCSPECATAYLMNEKIDSSIKFERYQLLNYLYSSVYNYNKNIKPAPNPYYTLDKYYGNLTIQEYRKLFNNDQLLIVVEKPLTHIFPELYEDNDEFIVNKRTIPKNTSYKLKKKNTNETNNIMDNFGIQSTK